MTSSVRGDKCRLCTLLLVGLAVYTAVIGTFPQAHQSAKVLVGGSTQLQPRRQQSQHEGTRPPVLSKPAVVHAEPLKVSVLDHGSTVTASADECHKRCRHAFCPHPPLLVFSPQLPPFSLQSGSLRWFRSALLRHPISVLFFPHFAV